MKQAFLLIVASIITLVNAQAQPVQRFIGGSDKDQITQIIPAADGNFLAVGAKQAGTETEVWLLKLTPNGDILWEKTFSAQSPGIKGLGYGIKELADGNILITGAFVSDDVFSTGSGLAIKTNAAGDELWNRQYSEISALYDVTPVGNDLMFVGWEDYNGSPSGGVVMRTGSDGAVQWKQNVDVYDETRVRKIFPTADGKLLLVGRTNVTGAGFEGIFLRKIALDGTQIWQKTADTQWRESFISVFDIPDYDQPLGAVQQPDGSIWIATPNGYNSDIALFHYDANGELVDKNLYGSASVNEYPYSLTALADGGFLIAGEAVTDNFPADYQGFAMKISPTGLESWRHEYGSSNSTDKLFSAVATANNEYLMAGVSNNISGNGNYDGWFIRSESDGNVLPWSIHARVVLDLNNNCQADPGEPPAAGWFVSATDTVTRLFTTDSNGQFVYQTGDGVTSLNVILPEPSNTWTICNPDQTVSSNNTNPTSNLIFVVKPVDVSCPNTEVSITQPDFVRCESSSFFVTVQNHGIGESGELLLNIALDPALSIVSASESFTQNGQALVFEIPPMSGLAQKIIEIKVALSCDVQIGATHSVVARLTPVECAPAWNGPQFAVEGTCTGDQVLFSLKNQGSGGANAQTRYRVMADDLLARDWTNITLPEGGAPENLVFQADGRTWRVELEQVTGFPINSAPAAAIEGCNVGANGLYSIGMVNNWRFDEGAPDVAAILAPNTTRTSDIVAEATHGFGSDNLIGDTQWLEYTARIRNPLNKKAEQVEFRLNFSENFDLKTFQPLAYNAPVRVELDNNKVIHVTMKNVVVDSGAFAMLRFRILPDANTPADASQYSTFKVNATAYFNNEGPFALLGGYHNYSKKFPLVVDTYNQYPSDLFKFGGRSYDFGVDISAGNDGSMFIAGSSHSFNEGIDGDGLLIKTDTHGKAKWLNAYPATQSAHNSFNAVVPLPDGGCLVSGNVNSNYTVSPEDIYATITRVDSNGRVLWVKMIRPAGAGSKAYASGLIATEDGNFIQFGHCTIDPRVDQFYVKINADGDVIWQKYQSIDGSAFRPTSAVNTENGSVVFMGSNLSTVIYDEVYLEKIDPDGNTIWTKGYDSEHNINIGGLARSDSGELIVNGYSQWSPGLNQYISTPTFMRFTAQGDLIDEKNPVIGDYSSARLTNITPTSDNGFISVGDVNVAEDSMTHNTDMLVLKTDSQGNILWWKHHGSKNFEFAYDALYNADNQIFVVGNNEGLPPLSDLQMLLLHTDMNGNISDTEKPTFPISTTHVTVFPNPANDEVIISFPATPTQNIPWELCDVAGRIIRSGSTSDLTFHIDVKILSPGTYFLTFPQRQFGTQRVVVLH